MTVRLRLALTILLTGLATACGVLATVALAFQRFEHQSMWQRADAFLGRVVAQHDDLLDQHRHGPEAFTAFLRTLLLYEPGSQLYLLAPDGSVLAHTGKAVLAPGFKVALAPVQAAAEAAARGDRERGAYVMGDDPEEMEAGAVVAARALAPPPMPRDAASDGWLYLVSRRTSLPGSRWELLRSSLATPALASVLAVILLATLLAAWIIGAVTRPLRVLSDEVAAAARAGFGSAAVAAVPAPPPVGADDEFGRLRSGFHALLATLRMQWDALRRLDHFRRESVSNLSHDLRSPLTAAVACLETLERRWADDAARGEDARLVGMALRNTRNAAAMVRSLGDLAWLDEPEFKLEPMRLDLGEVLGDIALRFAERAARQGVSLRFEQAGAAPPVAGIDVELFERAIANLVDNALKFTPGGGSIVLDVERAGASVRIGVADSGSGIAAADLPHLFDRHYQTREGAVPRHEGKGLGLAIVRRIVELHAGRVEASSTPGRGTTVTITLPAS